MSNKTDLSIIRSTFSIDPPVQIAREQQQMPNSIKTTVISAMNADTASPMTSGGGDYCIYKGQKYAINERIEDGCERICKCMASSVSVECEPRCPKVNHTSVAHEQCVSVPDPKDLCCYIELCDVTLDDHEQGAIAIVPAPPSLVDAMKNRNASNTNHTSNGFNNDDKELTSTAATGDNRDPNEKYDCQHNGSKYKIGTHTHKESLK